MSTGIFQEISVVEKQGRRGMPDRGLRRLFAGPLGYQRGRTWGTDESHPGENPPTTTRGRGLKSDQCNIPLYSPSLISLLIQAFVPRMTCLTCCVRASWQRAQ